MCTYTQALAPLHNRKQRATYVHTVVWWGKSLSTDSLSQRSQVNLRWLPVFHISRKYLFIMYMYIHSIGVVGRGFVSMVTWKVWQQRAAVFDNNKKTHLSWSKSIIQVSAMGGCFDGRSHVYSSHLLCECQLRPFNQWPSQACFVPVRLARPCHCLVKRVSCSETLPSPLSPEIARPAQAVGLFWFWLFLLGTVVWLAKLVQLWPDQLYSCPLLLSLVEHTFTQCGSSHDGEVLPVDP